MLTTTEQAWDSLSRLIGRGIEIKNRILTVEEKRHSGGKRSSHMTADISDLEIAIGRMMEAADQHPSLEAVRDHLIEIYTKVGVHLLKK